MRRDNVKALYGRILESCGGNTRAAEAKFMQHITPLVEGVDGKKPKLTLDNVSLRGLWEGLVGPCSETLEIGMRHSNRTGFQFMREESGTSLFPKVTGALIAAKVIEGYNDHAGVGDSLVHVMNSRLKTETVAGFTSLDDLKEVKEGMPYEDSGIGEKFVTSTAVKRGRILSLTEEAIYFDQTGQLAQRASRLGDRAKLNRDKRILEGVTGSDANVYKPAGVATTLYSTGHANLQVSNALVDWTDVDTMLQLIAAQTDDGGVEKINTMPRVLLCGLAKMMTANRIVGATGTRGTAGSNEETIGGNPVAALGLTVVSNALVDGFITAGDWFLGDFKRAFGYQTIWPIQTVMAREGHEDEFNRDVVFKYKVREFGAVFCLDHRLVYKSQEGA